MSEEGLGIGDASMLFAGGAISSMSAGGWLFSVSVGDRVSSSKSRSVSSTSDPQQSDSLWSDLLVKKN